MKEKSYKYSGIICERSHVETVMQDNTGIYFLVLESKSVSDQGEVERECDIYQNSLEKDFELFQEKNGIFEENCKIYLN